METSTAPIKTKKEAEEVIREAGRANLRKFFETAKRRGNRVHFTIPQRSRSGMSRQIQLFVVTDDHRIDMLWPSYYGVYQNGSSEAKRLEEAIAKLGDWKAASEVVRKDWGFNIDKRAFVVGGCGMDMVFHLIYTLFGQAYGNYDLGEIPRHESIG